MRVGIMRTRSTVCSAVFPVVCWITLKNSWSKQRMPFIMYGTRSEVHMCSYFCKHVCNVHNSLNYLPFLTFFSIKNDLLNIWKFRDMLHVQKPPYNHHLISILWNSFSISCNLDYNVVMFKFLYVFFKVIGIGINLLIHHLKVFCCCLN